MAVLQIKTPNAQALGTFNRTVSLEGINYQFQFYENTREGFWYFNFLDTEGNPIRTSIKIVSNWAFLRTLRTTPRPPGDIISIDTRNIKLDPGIDEFGIDVILGYIESTTDLS